MVDVNEWRVTKYDPHLRDRGGAFRVRTWTSATQIGEVFHDGPLTLERYLEIEDRYVLSAGAFFLEAGIDHVAVRDLEPVEDVPASYRSLGLGDVLTSAPPLHEGQQLTVEPLAHAVRLNLRELAWCRLELPSRFFVHFGYDYYMYVGSRAALPGAVQRAGELGLFVEPRRSPHHSSPNP